MITNFPTKNHSKRSLRNILLFLGSLVLVLMACNIALFTTPTPAVIVITATVSAPTDTLIPSATTIPPTAIQVVATATTGPSCTVLQDLNLRSGPGTAYNPPLAILKAETRLVPSGYKAQGVPGGPWVQVQVEGSNQAGWVSAGTQYVSCNLELASLPDVSVPPPPKPPLPKVGTGAVDGNNISSFRFSLEYDPDYFVRMYVFRSDDSDEDFSANKDGRGITSVEFTVSSPNGNRTFYERRENNAGYCIFGGGEPDCNVWIFENGQYKWKAGGDPVVERNYLLTINVTANDGEVGTWLIPVNIDLP